MRSYEDAVAFLGQWGRFQQVIFLLLCATIMPNGFGGFSLVFLSDTPKHSCFVPENNLTADWRESIIPITMVNGLPQKSKCSRYRLDVVRNLSAQGLSPGRDINLTDLEQESCVDGWSYSKDVYQSTIVSQFDMVCRAQWKRPVTTTVFFAGVFCGSFFSGHLSDRFGRKPILFVTIGFQTVFTFIQAFSTSWPMFLIILFLNGLGQMSNFVAALVLGAEILTGNIRVLYSSLGTNLGFAIGYMLLPLCAYFFRDWKSLLYVLSAPCVVYIPLWWVIPESPRWLLSQARVAEAEAIVTKAAKWNKVRVPSLIFQDCNVKSEDDNRQHNALDLFRMRNIRQTTILLCVVWFTINLTYYTVSYNTSQLHANPYISCFISAVVEVPGYISSWLALRYLPRRLSLLGILLFSAVPLYIIQVVPQNLPAVSITLEMVTKYFITTGYALMFAVTTELYPTVLRNTATGLISTASRLGSCLSPFLLNLSSWQRFQPYNILATLTFLSAIPAYFLPESFQLPLPETIEEMQQSGRDLFSCRQERKNPVPPELSDGPI